MQRGWILCKGVGSVQRGGFCAKGWNLCKGVGSVQRSGISAKGRIVQRVGYQCNGVESMQED